MIYCQFQNQQRQIIDKIQPFESRMIDTKADKPLLTRRDFRIILHITKAFAGLSKKQNVTLRLELNNKS